MQKHPCSATAKCSANASLPSVECVSFYHNQSCLAKSSVKPTQKPLKSVIRYIYIEKMRRQNKPTSQSYLKTILNPIRFNTKFPFLVVICSHVLHCISTSALSRCCFPIGTGADLVRAISQLSQLIEWWPSLTTYQRADSDIESQKSNCKLNHNPAFENLSMIFPQKRKKPTPHQ
jgi:hypothetical protein